MSVNNFQELLDVIDSRVSNKLEYYTGTVVFSTPLSPMTNVKISGDNTIFDFYNRSGQLLSKNDSVLIHAINGNLTNGYIIQKFGIPSTQISYGGINMNGNINFSNIITGKMGITGTIADNDQWTIRGVANGTDSGYLELATGDGGNEAIVVRQYGSGGVNGTSIIRTAYLLDSSGNTNLPKALNVGGQELASAFINFNNRTAFRGTDNWLRLNDTKAFTAGIYCGTGIFRTDGELQVGENGNSFRVIPSSSQIIASKRFYANGGIDKVLRADSLFNNSAGVNGTITLGASAGNYQYLEIFFMDTTANNRNARNSVKIESPNGKYISVGNWSPNKGTSNSLRYALKTMYVNGTSISNTDYLAGFTTGGDISYWGVSEIAITKVLGYKD